MYDQPIATGPGPSHPKTDFGQSATFTVFDDYHVAIQASFNTTWVSYIYIYNPQTEMVIAELTNDTGGSSWWNPDPWPYGHYGTQSFGVLNYFKANVSPGQESAGDIYTQGKLALENRTGTNQGSVIEIGFSDQHSSANNNALATIYFTKRLPIFHLV